MSNSFYITFWAIVIALTIFALIYAIFAFDKLGEVQDLKDRTKLLEVRDFLQWTAILLGIVLAVLILVLIFSISFGFNDIYEAPGAIFILYMGFLVWFLAVLALLIVSYERLGSSRDILQLTDVQIARRDLFLVIAAVSTISALLTLGYYGYVYKMDNHRDC